MTATTSRRAGAAPAPLAVSIALLCGLGLLLACARAQAQEPAPEPAAPPPPASFDELKARYEAEKTHEDPERLATIEAFGTVRTVDCAKFLVGLFKVEQNPGIVGALVRALGKIGNRDAVRGIIEQGVPLLTATGESLNYFEFIGEWSLRAALEGPLDDDAVEWLVRSGLTPAVRKHSGAYGLVLTTIAKSKHPRSASALAAEITKATDPESQVALLRVFRDEKIDGAAKAAARFMTSKDVSVQIAALEVLITARVADASSRSKYERLLASPHWQVQVLAIDLLALYKDPRLVPKLTPHLKAGRDPVRLAAIAALVDIATKDVIEPLILALEGQSPRVQDGIADALTRLTGVDMGPVGAQWESWWASNKGGAVEIRRRGQAEFLAAKEAKANEDGRTAVYHGLRVHSNFCAFIIDCSESMLEVYEPKTEKKPEEGRGGTVVVKKGAAGAGAKKSSKMDVAKSELAKVLGQLRDGIATNVIRFNTLVDSWRPELEGLTSTTRPQLVQYVQASKPEGLTNIFEALELAFADEKTDTIFLLSDGAPTHGKHIQPMAILNAVATMNRLRKVKINTIGFHLKPEEQKLLEDLAEQNFGVFVSR